ncbi:MAG TPA: M48 family metalloprotease [Desulfatiglandales bacterium]|nr:M48 family metalloprotease [Desulfatiglandales bacterium]
MRYAALILIGCLVAAACSTTNPRLVKGGFIVKGDEQRLWQRSIEEQQVLDNSGFVYRDGELREYLNGIVRRLQPPETQATMPFRIAVLKDPHLNAFAFPNGVIYVHTGILARMDNEAQFATLLAHEMAHCTHRHALRAFRDFKRKKDRVAVLQKPEPALDHEDLMALLGSTGTVAAVTGYSQDLEVEADLAGLELALNAGYDLKEAPRLFEHLKKELEEEKAREPFFFGTHPRLQKRIQNCKEFLRAHCQGREEGVKNTEIFLRKIQKVVLENALLDLKAGRFPSAYRGLEKYLSVNPHDPRAYYLLGEVCRQRARENDITRAKEYYEKAILLDPSYPEPYKAVGLIYYKEGEKRLARRSFESCLSLSPHEPDSAYIRGYLEQCDE